MNQVPAPYDENQHQNAARPPASVDTLLVPSIVATAIASQGIHRHANLTSYLQNEKSSMHIVPAGALWSGYAVKQPNLKTHAAYGPQPSKLASFFRAQIQRVQDTLGGAP